MTFFLSSILHTTVDRYNFSNLSISWPEKCVLLMRFSTIFFSCFLIAVLELFSDIFLKQITVPYSNATETLLTTETINENKKKLLLLVAGKLNGIENKYY